MRPRSSARAADLLLVAEAVLWLGLARLAIAFLPFRYVAPCLGRLAPPGEGDREAGGGEMARRVGWAVEAAARRVPWNAVCLPQAIAAQRMLRRRHVESTLYLGIEPGQRQAAHAWVQGGERVVVGWRRQPCVALSAFR